MNLTLRAALAAALVCAGTAVHASDLTGTEYAGVTPLYTLNQTTGALLAGPPTGMNDIGDLASTGLDNTVWAIQIGSNTLFRFDAATGAAIATVPVVGSVAPTGAPEKIVSIAIDAKSGQMFGNSDITLGGGDDLFKIDKTTGAATWVGNLQIDAMFALAFNSVDGFLYGASGAFGAPSTLWKIDPSNAATTFIGNLRPNSNFDIAFRPEDNTLFMASSGANELYTVDIASAATTLVGPYGSATNIAGLAFAVPEPGTWALMLGGLAALGALRRRQR